MNINNSLKMTILTQFRQIFLQRDHTWYIKPDMDTYIKLYNMFSKVPVRSNSPGKCNLEIFAPQTVLYIAIIQIHPQRTLLLQSTQTGL